MFGVLFSSGDGQLFRLYLSLDQAENAAQNAVCGLGWEATVFDYDVVTNTYTELYTI